MSADRDVLPECGHPPMRGRHCVHQSSFQNHPEVSNLGTGRAAPATQSLGWSCMALGAARRADPTCTTNWPFPWQPLPTGRQILMEFSKIFTAETRRPLLPRGDHPQVLRQRDLHRNKPPVEPSARKVMIEQVSPARRWQQVGRKRSPCARRCGAWRVAWHTMCTHMLSNNSFALQAGHETRGRGSFIQSNFNFFLAHLCSPCLFTTQ